MALANLMTSLPYVLVPPIASVVLGSPGATRTAASSGRSRASLDVTRNSAERPQPFAPPAAKHALTIN